MAVTAGAGAPWLYLIGDDTPTNVGAVAVDPAHPSTWYTGDGLVGNWRWVYTFRSSDGGSTWTANQLLYKTDGPVGQVVYHRVFALAVDPGDASTVLAAVAEQRTAYGGVYKSTDAGASWSRTLPDWATALAFDPTSPGRVYAGAVRYGKVFSSTDSGTTWTQIGGSTLEALRVYDIAVAPNGHVYVATNGGLQKWNGTAWSTATGLPSVPTIALAIDRVQRPRHQLFSGLTRQDEETGAIVPDLAESWTVAPDGMSVTFNLRSGLRWSDGTPLTASDVVFGLDRARQNSPYNWILDWVGVSNATALTSRLVRVDLSRPHGGALLSVMATFYAFPVPEHAIAAFGSAWADISRIVTSGPYRSGGGGLRPLILERNPLYHDASGVAIDRVEFYAHSDAAAATHAVRQRWS